MSDAAQEAYDRLKAAQRFVPEDGEAEKRDRKRRLDNALIRRRLPKVA